MPAGRSDTIIERCAPSPQRRGSATRLLVGHVQQSVAGLQLVLALVEVLLGQTRVVGALGVLHHHVVPVELCMAVDLASLLQSGLVQGVLLLGQGLDVGVQLGRQLVLAVGGLLLPLDDLPRQVGMAALALLHDGRILGGVHQVVGAVLGAVLGLGGGHVAIGAGVALLGHGGLRAAVDSLELGMLGLQHGGAGLGVLPILEAHLVVVGENGLGGHALEPRVGIRGGLGLGSEVILVVALAAHLGIGGDLIHIGTHGIHEELLGDRGLRRVVLMAVVAADGLGHLHEHLGEGLLVKYVIDNKEKGMSISENADWIIAHRNNICHWFTVDDLFFLKRGGRISATTAVVGTALSIKPVLHVDDNGHLIPMENDRGRKKSLDALVKHMKSSIIVPDGQSVYISHGDCIEDAEYVAKKVRENFNIGEVVIRMLDPVIASHSGPGTVALFFYGEHK